jgi:DNA topoisomerase-1
VLSRENHHVVNAEPQLAAASAGLRYVTDSGRGLRRRKAGRGFCYISADGTRLSDAEPLQRVRSLVIPPAWTDVWICPFPDGHLQATGRDARRRKQYLYHRRFREIRDSAKYQHVIAFADALPAIRARVRDHMALPGLPREKIFATVVYLLDKTLIRIGNDDYARQNKSYGLTTLRNRHVEITGSEVRFHFVGKSGKEWSAKIRDRRVAKIIRACQELPGQQLLQYRGEDGAIQDVTSGDINDYLREITGQDVTAKDFRTWAGTVLAAIALQNARSARTATKVRKSLSAAIATVAARLGNTPAICRKCYVHPDVLDAFLGGTLAREFTARSKKSLRDKIAEYAPAEAAVLKMLRLRQKAATNDPNGSEHLRRQLTVSLRRLRSHRPPQVRISRGNVSNELGRSHAAAL